jgi:HTH-type transcriptional regulator/antitoxin HipB
MKKKTPKLTRLEDHLDAQYGKLGTGKREKYEQGFETFLLGTMLHDMRKQQGLTQEQLAEKCGTTKTYISRIENHAEDMRLSTLLRIVQDGLGGQLKWSVQF